MSIKYNIFFILLISPFISLSQIDDQYESDSIEDDLLYKFETDSIPQSGIRLKEVVLFQPLRFKSMNELRDYVILRNRTLRVYPYAKMASDRLDTLSSRLKSIKSKKNKKTYFSNNQTLGKNPIDIENQGKAGFPENSRLMIDNVAFITAHVIGSNNNFDPSNERNTNEFKKRDVANINWIKDSFKKYEKASAYVVAIHADMYSEGSTFSPVYEKFGLSLYNLSNDYNKPVLILYGDSHEYKNFQPMKENYPLIYAIENYGNPDINALLIEVDTSKKNPFIVVKVIKGESTKTWLLRNLRRVERKLLSLIS